MAPGLISGLFRYGQSELDPAVHAEILIETARNEARTAILEIFLALIFGGILGFNDPRFQVLGWFVLVTVVFLLTDAALRRSAGHKLRGVGPQPR